MVGETQGKIPSTREIAERGEAFYKSRWEASLTKSDPGKFVAIDFETGDATLGITSEEAVRKALEKKPTGYFHLIRVGQKNAFNAGWYMSHAC